ncbi:protein kinase [Loigolactobacillus coryniformis]|uniref:protein kinase n=1 Tax=Loigolactobacillus coryniformis TaxID=1610 RepID=UPI00387EC4D7
MCTSVSLSRGLLQASDVWAFGVLMWEVFALVRCAALSRFLSCVRCTAMTSVCCQQSRVRRLNMY